MRDTHDYINYNQVRARQPNVTATDKRSDWTLKVDWGTTAKVVAACVLIVGLFALLKRSGREPRWFSTSGTIQETRVVTDHALQTKSGGQVTWKAEYKVFYSIAGHEYAVWADSGIRGEDEDSVRLVLPQSPPSCRVQYNPQSPAVSVAHCR